MTNIDCRDLLAHHLIPFGYHKEKTSEKNSLTNMEWFLSSHFGLMAANKLASS
jgi:hypothetical protein